mgnify:CR=1 FL=1
MINDNGWRCADPVVSHSSYFGMVNRTLVTEGSVGSSASVAIGVDGNPVISHYDQNNADLELAIPMFSVTGIAFE